MGATAAVEPEVLRPLRRSFVYEVLSLGFAYPEQGTLERLRELLAEARDPALRAEPSVARLDGLRRHLARVDRPDLESCHNALFSGSVACPAHETEYESDAFAKTHQLADVAGFYRAFGLEVSGARPTMPDFIATELEFMSLLCRKEAYAASHGWTERVGLAADAERDFLRDHLGRWVAVFCDELRRQTADRPGAAAFYRALAELCGSFVESELAIFGIRPVRLERRMRGPSDGEPAACGMQPSAPEPE
jgi:DMSO reductase family type II enzyme chaperone